MESRRAVAIPFIDEAPLEEIQGAKLPTKTDIFRHYWHHHKSLKKKSSIAVRDAAKSVMAAWTAAGLKPKTINYVAGDINEWVDLLGVIQWLIER